MLEKYKVSCKDAIETICRAGGLSVLAHPGLLRFNRTGQDEGFIDILIGYGLDGMEVFYSEHNASLTEYYQCLAQKKGLLMTGGSDFHGSFHPEISLGTGKENLCVDIGLYKHLADRLEDKRKTADLGVLEKNLGHVFTDITLLENALCHRSYLNENLQACESDNERLEFLGDAVVGLCIAHLLMAASPAKKEGELSKLRSSLVSEPGLAKMARRIDLGRFIRLGKGEALSGGQEKNSILSDALEAVIAAVYLDSDFNTVYCLVQALFTEAMESLLAQKKIVDYKSLLQEYVQENGAQPPQYQVDNELGPDHDKTFEVCLELFDIQARGLGKTKKAAEQKAAQKALKLLGRHSG